MSKYGDPGFAYHKAMSQYWGLAVLRLSEALVSPTPTPSLGPSALYAETAPSGPMYHLTSWTGAPQPHLVPHPLPPPAGQPPSYSSPNRKASPTPQADPKPGPHPHRSQDLPLNHTLQADVLDGYVADLKTFLDQQNVTVSTDFEVRSLNTLTWGWGWGWR